MPQRFIGGAQPFRGTYRGERIFRNVFAIYHNNSIAWLHGLTGEFLVQRAAGDNS